MAGPPSPLEPSRPVPITLVRVPFGAIRETTAPCASATMSEPSGATTTCTGQRRQAGDDRRDRPGRRIDPPDAAAVGVGDVDGAVRADAEPVRTVDLGGRRGTAVAARGVTTDAGERRDHAGRRVDAADPPARLGDEDVTVGPDGHGDRRVEVRSRRGPAVAVIVVDARTGERGDRFRSLHRSDAHGAQ